MKYIIFTIVLSILLALMCNYFDVRYLSIALPFLLGWYGALLYDKIFEK
jgi:hypothetical protein